MTLAKDRDQATLWNPIVGLGRDWTRTVTFVDDNLDPYPVLAADVTATIERSTPIAVTVAQGATSNAIVLSVTAATLGTATGGVPWSVELDGQPLFAGTFQVTPSAVTVPAITDLTVTVGAAAEITATVVSGAVDNHIADAVGAHAATAVSFDGTAAGLAATNVKAAIDEVVTDYVAADAVVDAVIDDHIADAAGAHAASAISAPAVGSLTGTTVAAQLAELDAELLSMRSGKGLVCITMDDADADMLTVAAMLEQRGQRGTFTITTDYLGQGGKITTAQVAALAAAGHQIAAHSKTHANMTSLTPATRVTEWETPKTILEAIDGVGTVDTWCYPFGTQGSGRNATTDLEAASRYHRILDTAVFSAPTYTYPRYDPPPGLIVRRGWSEDNLASILAGIREAAERPVIFTVYFHSLGEAINPTAADVTQALDLAVSLGVPVVTINEAFGSLHLLNNPSFEDDASDRRPWHPVTSGGGSTAIVTVTPPDGIGGTRALRCGATATSGSFGYVRQVVPVTPGVAYRLSFWTRKVSGTISTINHAFGRIVGIDATQTDAADTVQTAVQFGATTWTLRTLDYTPGTSTRFAIVDLVVQNFIGEVEFDAVRFGPKNLGVLG